MLIGATTENPYLSILPAIRSRTQIFEVKPLSEDDMKTAIQRALTDKERGLGNFDAVLDDEAERQLVYATNGDLRSALNGLELAVKSTAPSEDGKVHITLPIVEETVQRKALTADKDGDGHYDVISALQKSIRGSDTDAALHYLARLIEAGDLPIIARRLRVIAYEDIGLANPAVAARAVTAIEAAEKLGFPEARIPLANATIELALSPKSNSAYTAIDAALADVRKGGTGDVPDHLRDAHYKGAEKLGHGVEYVYPHGHPAIGYRNNICQINLTGRTTSCQREILTPLSLQGTVPKTATPRKMVCQLVTFFCMEAYNNGMRIPWTYA